MTKVEKLEKLLENTALDLQRAKGQLHTYEQWREKDLKRIARLEIVIEFLGGWVENLAIKHGVTEKL